ncbi:MAG: ThiF family adenylyltransferase [Bacillota bacterium]
MLNHETLFRSEEIMEKRSNLKVFVLGLGALGSNLIPFLIRNGYKNITGIDFDRIEKHNIGNQFYSQQEVGRKKSQILKNKIYRELGIAIDTIDKKIQEVSSSYLEGYDLFVDTFDNWESRGYFQELWRKFFKDSSDLIHSGMSPTGYSQIKWDENYNIPKDYKEELDVCDYALSCNLVYFTVSLLSESINTFCDKNLKTDYSFTLNDLKISQNQNYCQK